MGSDNGYSPGRRQAIIWANAGILLIGPVRMNVTEMLIEIETFSLKKMHLKMSWNGGHFVSIQCVKGHTWAYIPGPHFTTVKPVYNDH